MREMTFIVSFVARAAQFCSVTLLAAPLWLSTACINYSGDGDEVNAQVQEAIVTQAVSGCTVRRPLTWIVGDVPCMETVSTVIFLADGDRYTALSHDVGSVIGTGSMTLQCNNGELSIIRESCSK